MQVYFQLHLSRVRPINAIFLNFRKVWSSLTSCSRINSTLMSFMEGKQYDLLECICFGQNVFIYITFMFKSRILQRIILINSLIYYLLVNFNAMLL